MASIASGCYLDEPLVHKSHLPLDPALIGTWEDKDRAKWNVTRHSETEYAIRDSKGEPMIAFPGRLGNKSFIQITVPQSGGKLIYVVISYAVSGDTLEISMLDPKPATATPIGFAEIKNAFLQNLNPDKFFAKIGTFKKINAASETAKSPPAKQKPQDANLLSAAGRGDLASVKQAIAQGADVNAKDVNGTTALMMAAKNGHGVVVKELLAKGADFSAKDNNWKTAFDHSVAAKHDEITIDLVIAKEKAESDKRIAQYDEELAELKQKLDGTQQKRVEINREKSKV